MGQVDKKQITKKLQELNDYLQKLEEFRRLDLETYVSDYHHYGLAEHYLQLAVETILDICRSIVISSELKIPDDSHGLLPLLAEKDVLSKNFAERNAQMPGFRNRLVHNYEAIDHAKTYEYLQDHFVDLQEFMKKFGELVKEK